MRKQDIKPGVVYAYQGHNYSSPEPVVFLSTDVYVTKGRYGREDEPWAAKAPAGSKVGRDYAGHYTGYVVVHRNYGVRDVTEQEVISEMLALTAADWQGTCQTVKGAVHWGVETNLRTITGVYDEVAAEHKARRQENNRIAAEREAEEQASRARAIDIITALSAYGITVNRIPTYGAVESVSLPLGAAERVAELLRAVPPEALASVAEQFTTEGEKPDA